LSITVLYVVNKEYVPRFCGTNEPDFLNVQGKLVAVKSQ